MQGAKANNRLGGDPGQKAAFLKVLRFGSRHAVVWKTQD
jgi:hypothetical protein